MKASNLITKGFKAAQKGFTLVELVIVVIVLGILGAVSANQFGPGVTNGAKAQAIYESVNKLTDNWRLLTSVAGTSSNAATGASNVIPITAANSSLDVLIAGKAYMATAYQSAWDTAGIAPLTDVARTTTAPTSTTAGVYEIGGYQATMSGGGTVPLKLSLANVPDSVIGILNTKYGNGTALGTTANTTGIVIQWAASSTGSRQLDILKQP